MDDDAVTLVCDIAVVDEIRVDIEALIHEVGTVDTFADYGFTIGPSTNREGVSILQVFSHSYLLCKREPLIYTGYVGWDRVRAAREKKDFYAKQALELYIVMVIGLSAYEDQAARIGELVEQIAVMRGSSVTPNVKRYQTLPGIH